MSTRLNAYRIKKKISQRMKMVYHHTNILKIVHRKIQNRLNELVMDEMQLRTMLRVIEEKKNLPNSSFPAVASTSSVTEDLQEELNLNIRPWHEMQDEEYETEEEDTSENEDGDENEEGDEDEESDNELEYEMTAVEEERLKEKDEENSDGTDITTDDEEDVEDGLFQPETRNFEDLHEILKGSDEEFDEIEVTDHEGDGSDQEDGSGKINKTEDGKKSTGSVEDLSSSKLNVQTSSIEEFLGGDSAE